MVLEKKFYQTSKVGTQHKIKMLILDRYYFFLDKNGVFKGNSLKNMQKIIFLLLWWNKVFKIKKQCHICGLLVDGHGLG